LTNGNPALSQGERNSIAAANSTRHH